MNRTLYSFSLCFLCLCSSAHAAKEILLRTAPEAGAPVIAKVAASEKVILDAAPAPRNAEAGWRQLALPTPFEGYVPTAAMSKNFEIVEGTPVRYLPSANAARITLVEEGDAYEFVRAKEDWATVRFRKHITGYFTDDATKEVALNPDIRSGGFSRHSRHLQKPDTAAEAAATQVPKPAPEPLAIPAPRARVNPDEPISQLDPNSLPPENVVWKPARSRGSKSKGESGFSTKTTQPASEEPDMSRRSPARAEADLMVTPAQTQAREAAPELGPAKAPRLLTGILKQNLANDGAAYPIRLRSPEGRLVAYVDFSGIYISDLTPYLDQKVYVRGQIYPLPGSSSQLVILAESLRLAE